MQLVNLPIDVIAQYDAVGTITPLRLRLEDDTHQLITAKIITILYMNENNYAGTKTIAYGCKVSIGQIEKLIELTYHVASHKWLLRKCLC